MYKSVADELAITLEEAVPRVSAQALPMPGGYVIVASFRDSAGTHQLVIRDTAEFGLLLALLEQQADKVAQKGGQA